MARRVSPIGPFQGTRRRAPITSLLIGVLVALPLSAVGLTGSEASPPQQTPGCALPPPQTQIANILDSLEAVVISERTDSNVHAVPYRELEIEVSGRVAGCLVDNVGPRLRFVDAPDLWFSQLMDRTARHGPVPRGLAAFEATDGSGMTILYPESRSDWNGKLWILQHGTGTYTEIGQLVPRAPGASFDPLTSENLYAALMVDRGYAVVWIRKDNAGAAPVSQVQLEDGTVVMRALDGHATLELALIKYAQLIIERQLGERPRRTYFYGFSQGALTGRLLNYTPEANIDRDGTRIVDGFLIDDAGGGLPLPVLFRGDEDVLLTTARDQGNFAPQLDISHALYLPDSFLVLKRENARLLLEKGLGDKHRVYEVLGVSHFDAGDRRAVRPEALDLGGLMEAMIDLMDSWVDTGIAPPPSRAHGVAGIAGPPIALPEIACPLGVYYAFPAGQPNENQASQTTAFARFDGTSFEPLDWRGEFVDMNENSVQDERESVETAWRRLGLLGPREEFTAERYARCVEAAAIDLAQGRLLPWRVVDHYRSEATRFMADARPDGQPQ
jgi:hypothetical protein